MFFRLLLFEWRYHRQHISFLVFAVVFLGAGFLLSNTSFGEANLYHNATYNTQLRTGLLSLFAILILMVLSSRVVLRDSTHQMSALIYTTPVVKFDFMSSRFFGLFLSACLLFSFAMFGFWLGAITHPERDQIGPILWQHYTWPFLLIAVPNLLLASSVLFTLASLTKNALATYTGGIFLYCLYWVCAIFLNSPMLAQATPASPEGLALAALLDPFGLSAFFEQSQYWEVMERNSTLVQLEGNFLWNRMIWMSVAVLLWLLNFRLFSFRKAKERLPKNQTIEEPHFTPLPAYSQAKIKLSFHQLGAVFTQSFWMEMRLLFKSWPLWLAICLWIGVVGSEIFSRIYGGGEYGTDLYPTTDLMIWLIADPYQFMSRILVIFFGGEIMARERSVNWYEIQDATPAKNGVFFFSKLLSLTSIPILLIVTAIGVAILSQVIKGYFFFEPLQYLSLFYLLGWPLLLFSISVLMVQTLVSNKYLGMFLCLALELVLTSSLSSSIGIEHPIWKVGAFPNVPYTNMNGFDPQLSAFHLFALYWGSFGLLSVFMSWMLWKRGQLLPLFSRLKLAFNKDKRTTKMGLGASLVLFLATGAYVYYNTNVLNDFSYQEAELDRRAAYEKKYREFDELPDLRVVDLVAQVDLFPAKGSFKMTHQFTLRNKTEEVINEQWFTVPRWLNIDKLTLSNATLVQHDTLHGVYWFQMNQGVKPGEEVQLDYDISYTRQGVSFHRSLPERAIVSNGTNIMSRNIIPRLGYRSDVELQDNRERRKRGLPERAVVTNGAIHAGLEEEDRATYNKFDFEATVSTASDQIAIAPGNLVKSWTEQDRRYFHYKADQAINHFYSYISADYEQDVQSHDGISLEVYYDKKPAYNIDRIQETMKQTLDYCQAAFGPYTFDHLRIAEIPGHWPMGGYATAGTIALVENRSFLTDLRDPAAFDVVAKRVSHEVAHQWFGHQLTPRSTAGAAMLVESTAKYVEAVMLEKMYGKHQLRHLLSEEMNRYFRSRNRSTTPEPALDQVDNQNYICYAKGAIVMNALRDLLGESTMNEAFRQLFEEHAYPKPKAEAIDFVNKLYELSSTEKHGQIGDWLSKIVIYDNQIEEVQYKALVNRGYEIQLTIKATKWQLTENGTLKEVAMDEAVNIGLFQQHPDQLVRFEEEDYYQKHQLVSGVQEISIQVKTLARYVAIDPYLHLMDKNTRNNIKQID